MKKLHLIYRLLMILLFLYIISCDNDAKCNTCGDVFGGFVFMEVTANDLTKYEGLAQLKGVDVGVCIRAHILEQELNVNSVTIIDDCCCQ